MQWREPVRLPLDEMQSANGVRLFEQVQELKGLLDVALVVVSSLNLDEVLQDILHSAMAVVDMPAGSIALH